MKSMTPVVTILAALAYPSLAQAAKFSDLIVVREAAQAGMWTMTTIGTYPDGRPFPSRKNTVCATKAEVINAFDNPFMWNEKSGEEDKSCPTKLTTNTSALGVATMICKAQTIAMPGGQSIAIPSTPLTTEFKRIGKDNWTVTTGNIVTTISYHGSATAACVAKR